MCVCACVYSYIITILLYIYNYYITVHTRVYMAELCRIMQTLTWQPICCTGHPFQASHAHAARMH